MTIEFRGYLTVLAPQPLPPSAWDRLAAVMERRFGGYGPVLSYWPDREAGSASVIVSTDGVPNRAHAAAILTAIVDRALVQAELGDCYVSAVNVERVPDHELVEA